MVNEPNQAKLTRLSPFEQRKRLIELAEARHKVSAAALLNAGRGNPNWIAVPPRAAFFLLGQFALSEAKREWHEWPPLAGVPMRDGMASRLADFLDGQSDDGAHLLRRAVAFGTERLGFDPDGWVQELTAAALGCHYPLPGRILPHVEVVAHEYLVRELCGGEQPIGGRYDLFAVEGATAAISYILDSLAANQLLKRGDSIAILVPTYAPYLEIPRLDRYGYRVLELRAEPPAADGAPSWTYADAELARLGDSSVKALFVVNPGNPTSDMLSASDLERIASVVKTRNPELMIVTDDVYATFVAGFRSLLAVLPHNTLAVYSFSKYFGCTGWRLGLIAVHQDNVFDTRLARLSRVEKAALARRYATITIEPEKLKFTDRLVADSRQVALNHTAGLSTPQQAQLALFALYALADRKDEWRSLSRSVIQQRLRSLEQGLGAQFPDDPLSTRYYVEFDLLDWAERNWGKEFARHLQAHHDPAELVFRLAERSAIVVLPGGGFDAPEWSVRISLANLRAGDYEHIGRCLREIG